MHRRTLYRLTYPAAAMSLGHHLDHLIRAGLLGGAAILIVTMLGHPPPSS
jgi:hypothetical protein